MAEEDLWQALLRTGHEMATEADYEHGYKREVRGDLSRYVTFNIGDEVYGLPIDQIVEISKVFDTTPVPRTAAFLRGIGNVRGSVIPVIDLPQRLRMEGRPEDRHTRVLIVSLHDELYGLITDNVREVLSIAPESLESAPGGIGSSRAEFITALGRNDGQIVIILDLASVLDERDFVLPRFARRKAKGA